MAFLPKRCLNQMEYEVARALRINDRSAEYITFKQISGEYVTPDAKFIEEPDPIDIQDWKDMKNERCDQQDEVYQYFEQQVNFARGSPRNSLVSPEKFLSPTRPSANEQQQVSIANIEHRLKSPRPAQW